MKTAINIALSDVMKDQGWYEYDSETGSIKNGLWPDEQQAYLYNSGVNGEGLIYYVSAQNAVFAYASNRKINGYSGFSIVTQAKPLLENPPMWMRYAVEYVGSKPEWVTDSLSSVEMQAGLAATDRWLKPQPTRAQVTKANRKVLAVIIDKLLQAAKENRRAQIGLVDLNNNNLAETQRMLIRALKKCLPVQIANRFSFNTNASGNAKGIDIFCTTCSPGDFSESDYTIIDVNGRTEVDGRPIANYKCSNSFAEFIETGTESPLQPRMETIDSIDALNAAVNTEVLKILCDKEIALSPEGIKQLEERYLRGGEEAQDKQILTAYAKCAYGIFFSKAFYTVAEESKIFFKKFLKPSGSVRYEDLCVGPNRFAGVGSRSLIEILESSLSDEERKKYCKFLFDSVNQDDFLYPAVNEAVNKFLYGSHDGYPDAVNSLIAAHLIEDIRLLAKYSNDHDYLVVNELRARYVTPKEKAELVRSIKNYKWCANSNLIQSGDFSRLEDFEIFYNELPEEDREKKSALIRPLFRDFLNNAVFVRPFKEAEKIPKERLTAFAGKIGFGKAELEGKYAEYRNYKKQAENATNVNRIIAEYRQAYYQGIPVFSKWEEKCKKDRTKFYKRDKQKLYSNKETVIFADIIACVIALIITFCVLHFAIYPAFISHYISGHVISEYRFLIEGIFVILLTAAGVWKIIYDIKHYNTYTKSLFRSLIYNFIEALILGGAVTAFLAVVLSIWFIVA